MIPSVPTTSPLPVFAALLLYALLLFAVSRLTGRRAGNAAFFTAERRTPWYVAWWAMIGAAMSGITFVSVPGSVAQDAFSYLQKLLHWRRGQANDVIARGSLKHFMPQNGIYAYRRALDDKEVIVLLNGNDTPQTVTMERTLEVLPYGSRLHDLISGTEVEITPEMTFAPRQVMILQNF